MFLGQHERRVDSKGRVVLPAQYRAQLEEGCYITKGPERCLYIFTLDAWRQKLAAHAKLSEWDPRARHMNRSFFSGASDHGLDSAGRVRLTPKLKQYAGLEGIVTVVGAGDRAEIWDTVTWNQYEREADDYYANIEEAPLIFES